MDGCSGWRFFETDGGGDGFEVVADFPEEVGLGSGGGACGATRVLPGRADFAEERSAACRVPRAKSLAPSLPALKALALAWERAKVSTHLGA